MRVVIGGVFVGACVGLGVPFGAILFGVGVRTTGFGS